MGFYRGPSVTREDLLVAWDFGSTRTYSGTGSTINNLLKDSYDGTITGATYNSAGHFTFDGSNDYIANTSTPSELQGNAAFTVEGIFRRVGTIYQDGLWGIGGNAAQGGICSWNYSNNEIGIDLWGTTTFGTGETYSTTEWKHIVWTYNGTSFTNSNISIFVNNTKYTGTDLITRRGGSGTPNINSAGITLGKIHPTVNSYWANGEIKYFRVYSRVLTDDEVAGNYNALKARAT